MVDFSLRGQHALVTGGSRGIGLAIAAGFLDQGAAVTICSRRQEHLDQALEHLSRQGSKCRAIQAHVGQSAEIQRLVDDAQDGLGPIDILVNNAGTNPYFGPLVDAEEAAWDKTMDVNLKGPYLLSREVARRSMDAGRGGSIINIASVAGLIASPGQGIYSVSKAALIMLTKVLARELGSAGVRVNCICPGLIKTRLSQALWQDPAVQQSVTAQKALGRIGQPDELVGAAVYLASAASSFTTGAVLQVDGGMVI